MNNNLIIKYIMAISIQLLIANTYCQPIKLAKNYNVLVDEDLLFNITSPHLIIDKFLVIRPVIKKDDLFLKIHSYILRDKLLSITESLYKHELPTEFAKINYLYSCMRLIQDNKNSNSLIIEFKNSSNYESIIFHYNNKDYYSIFDKPLNLFIFNINTDPTYINFKQKKTVSYAIKNNYKITIKATKVEIELNNNEIEDNYNYLSDNNISDKNKTKSLPDISILTTSENSIHSKQDFSMNRYSLTLNPRERIIKPAKIFKNRIEIINLSSNTSAETKTNIFVCLFSPIFLDLLESIRDNYIDNNTQTSFTKVLLNIPLFPVFSEQNYNKSFPLFTNIYSLYVACYSNYAPNTQNKLGYRFVFYKKIPIQYTNYLYKAPDQPENNNSYSLNDIIQNKFIEINLNNNGYIHYVRINEKHNAIEFIPNTND